MIPKREKLIESLPPIRLDDETMTALQRIAMAEDRKLSDVVRRILEKHLFGHAASVSRSGDRRNQDRALLCDEHEE